MKLLLVRHGHDLPGNNGDSALSWQGKKQAAQTAQRMLDMGIRDIDAAYCSPARRAVETLSEITGIVSVNHQHCADELQPGQDPESLVSLVWRHWRDEPGVILFVGHEPQLSNAVLRWCGLPENAERGCDTPPWVLGRGEGMLLSPSFNGAEIQLSSSLVSILGRQRAFPGSRAPTRAGVF